MACHNNMKFVIFISAWITLSYFCSASPDPTKRDVAWARIIAVEPTPSTQSWGFPSPLSPVTRGQFKNSILFRIHPDSPLNREAWIKSGFMSRESPPTKSFFSLLTPKSPPKVDFKGLKPKRPSYSTPRRKMQTQNDTILPRRIPKIDDPTNEFRLPEHNYHVTGNNFPNPGASNLVSRPAVPLKGPLTPIPLPNTPVFFSPFPSTPEVQPSRQAIPKQSYCYMQIPYTRPVAPLPLIRYLLPISWIPQYAPPSFSANEPDINADYSSPVATVTPTPPVVSVNKSLSEDDLVRSELTDANSETTTDVPEVIDVTPVLETVETSTTHTKSLGIKSPQQSGNSPNPQIIDVEFREDAVPQMNTKHELSTTTTSSSSSSSSSSNSNDGNANSETSTEETRNFNKLVVVPVEAIIPGEAEQRNPATESGESLLPSKENGSVSTRATIIEKTFRE